MQVAVLVASYHDTGQLFGMNWQSFGNRGKKELELLHDAKKLRLGVRTRPGASRPAKSALEKLQNKNEDISVESYG